MSDTPKASPEISPKTSPQEQGAQPASPPDAAHGVAQDVAPDAASDASTVESPQQAEGGRKPDAASDADTAQQPSTGGSAAMPATQDLPATPDKPESAAPPDATDTAAPPAASAPEGAAIPKAPNPTDSTGSTDAAGSADSPVPPNSTNAQAAAPSDTPVAASGGSNSKDEASASPASASDLAASVTAAETPPAHPATEAEASDPAAPASSTAAPVSAPSAPAPPTPEVPAPSAATPVTSPEPSPVSATPSPAVSASGRPMLRILLRALAALALLGLLAGGYAGYDAWRFLRTPPASPGADVYVDVEPGATFDRVTKQLVDKGAVTSDWRFKLLAHHHGWETSLKAGRFLVHSGWTPFRVLDQLVNGQPVLSRITLREGLTWWETARLLEAEGFVTVEDFRAVITDPAFLRHWGIPFDTAEGFLFPDTYLIKKPPMPDRESARAVAGRLVDTFWRRAAQVWPDGRPARDELRRLITLASIVEKETGLPAERGRVAGVYANRLRTGMLLQADPTTIYGLGETFDGNLRRPHLQDAANPYNTYRRPGLPPGPICSPGMESLRAATTPEKHGYFYFVSRNDGSHQFSATLDEHNRAVNRFQRAGRAKGTAQGTPTDAATPAPQTGPTAAQDERTAPAATTDADTGGNAATGKTLPPPAAEATGAKAGTEGAPGKDDAPAAPAASAAPAQAAPTSGTEAPAASPLPAKTSPGSKPAAEPLPRKAKNTGTKAEDATPAANAGVRAPTAPRETAQPGDGATSGAAPGRTSGTSGGTTGGTPETQGAPKALSIPGPPAPTATPAPPAVPVAPAPTSPETPAAAAAPAAP